VRLPNPQDSPELFFLLFIPAFFVIWLFSTTSLGLLSGWYSLRSRFPDRPEEPALFVLKNQSGNLNTVGMGRILHLSICDSGLRIGLVRLFGPFCKDFLVPWQSFSVIRKDRKLWRTAILDFHPGRLSLPSQVADRLARCAGSHWPETGPFPPETDADVGMRLAKQWLVQTTLAASFFVLAPRLMAPGGAHPPILVAVLFPAVVFGVMTWVQYLRRGRE
jgi:hypothetical protein